MTNTKGSICFRSILLLCLLISVHASTRAQSGVCSLRTFWVEKNPFISSSWELVGTFPLNVKENPSTKLLRHEESGTNVSVGLELIEGLGTKGPPRIRLGISFSDNNKNVFDELDVANAESVYDRHWRFLSVSKSVEIQKRTYTFNFGCQRGIAKNVCDRHLSQIKTIPFHRASGVDHHYDALKAAGKSAVPCLIANITNRKYKPDPRGIPRWGTMKLTVGDTAVFMLEDITGVDTIRMLPQRYQDLYKEIGVYARDEYLHDRRIHRRILQRKLWRWYKTIYLPSLR